MLVYKANESMLSKTQAFLKKKTEKKKTYLKIQQTGCYTAKTVYFLKLCI